MKDYYGSEITGDQIALAIEVDKCRIVWRESEPLGIVLDGQRPEGIPSDWWTSQPDFRQSVRVAGGEFASITLPVQPQDQGRVDESYRASGRGSIDNVFGTDFNQQEE